MAIFQKAHRITLVGNRLREFIYRDYCRPQRFYNWFFLDENSR